MRPRLPRLPRRAKLRTRVLLGVLSVTLVALIAFDVAAVTALRGYLLSQTDAKRAHEATGSSWLPPLG